jgi:hypothetical protein
MAASAWLGLAQHRGLPSCTRPGPWHIWPPCKQADRQTGSQADRHAVGRGVGFLGERRCFDDGVPFVPTKTGGQGPRQLDNPSA